ncbi:copper ABC transporter permease [Vagococcus fessus]|uniref:Copper ABC transporter permease n=1 Tax=Vagococcus fessus TaxID=120370 RepID=A0A430A858_9ENTE|nr:YfhO family protein [Vagococcus fessus]RSU03295.1 copper ABC transporter permease [Vagococcus fessus]
MTEIKTKKIFYKNKMTLYPLAAFLIPIAVMAGVYATQGIYWGSDRSLLASDAFAQFSNFHASFNNVLHGKQSIFYTWNSSLGLNYYALISYYLSGIFTPLVFFFKNEAIPDALYFLTLLKIGLAGLSFWYFAKHTYRFNPVLKVAFSNCYALMSFITAQSELIMWLDAFIYLPLIFLGIHKIMEGKNPTLLFVSYFLLFVSNFYFGFMVGLLSFLYFWARASTNWKTYKKSIPRYLITSFLAGIASMVMILPTVLDIRSNGEKLNKIAWVKTEATAFWDLIAKNMVGSYDGTKYGSIPFIYIGLVPLILCLFYFFTKKVPRRNKLAYGSIMIFIIISFYFNPLNLFWHGLHAPNMFLFRFAFTFSFMVIVLAGYGLEHLTKADSHLYNRIIIGLMTLVLVFYFTKGPTAYTYITIYQLVATLLFLGIYLITFYFFFKSSRKHSNVRRQHLIMAILALAMLSEAVANTSWMIEGIRKDWNYASRVLYSGPYSDINSLVKQTKKVEEDSFYRMESMEPVTANDGINYGYSGVSTFTSIRNRNTNSFLNELGYRSRGTNQNIRYDNNTLVMDSLLGIRYNISKNKTLKFGFKEFDKNNTLKMYQNDYANSLGMMAPRSLYKYKPKENAFLDNQASLLSTLSGNKLNLFTHSFPEVVSTTNTKIEEKDNITSFKELEFNKAKDITYKLTVPANKQAYLSLQPTNFADLKSGTAEITVGTHKQKTRMSATGQYYDLGFYDEAKTIEFTVSFFGTANLDVFTPKVIFLNNKEYADAFNKMKPSQVPFQVKGRKAKATVNVPEGREVLFTTIPYDKGWKAYVDGKKTKIKPLDKAFITLDLKPGQHEIEFVFLPYGFIMGVICFIASVGLFVLYLYWIKISTKKTRH